MTPGESDPRERLRSGLSWSFVAILTAVLTCVTTMQALERYHEFRTGWSWDLAYYNQWFWATTSGIGVISVQPVSAYAMEGPSVWKMNYLAPIRLAIIPFYMLAPGPKTLLVIGNVVFWWVIPAAFSLVRSETKSRAVALSAAALVPLNPLIWPLALNDFRELQMAIPFVLWAVQGVRGRSARLATIGIGGMLACRQEYAIIVATFCLIPAREREDIGRSYRWTQAMLLLGVGWFLFGFLGYLRGMVGSFAPGQYLHEFQGAKAPLGMTLETTFDLLAFGLGSWVVLAALAPRIGILALPWIWGMCSGRWSLGFLATEEWHHVRYTAPIAALVLAAGLVGYARAARLCLGFRRGAWAVAVVWLLAAAGCVVGLREVGERMSRIPRPIAAGEVEDVWRWIDRVAPDDGVLADYVVTAPLSSRRELYSYILDVNHPRGFPQLGPTIKWLFYSTPRLYPEVFQQQGFVVVYRGASMTILERRPP